MDEFAPTWLPSSTSRMPDGPIEATTWCHCPLLYPVPLVRTVVRVAPKRILPLLSM